MFDIGILWTWTPLFAILRPNHLLPNVYKKGMLMSIQQSNILEIQDTLSQW